MDRYAHRLGARRFLRSLSLKAPAVDGWTAARRRKVGAILGGYTEALGKRRSFKGLQVVPLE
jgi:hypothetical protein